MKSYLPFHKAYALDLAEINNRIIGLFIIIASLEKNK